MICASAVSYGVATPPTLTLSGQTVINTGAGVQTSGIRVNSDGTVDENNNGVFTQIDTSTDWVVPVGFAPDDYEVRVAAAPPGDAFTNSPGADGTWFALTSNREWNVVEANPTVGSTLDTGNFTIEIRKGSSGGADVSGTYNVQANRTS